MFNLNTWNFELRSRIRAILPAAITFFICLLLYSYLYTGKYFAQKIVLGGDTQLLWGPIYLFYYSLKHFHEVAWWDPTGINGWPMYYFLTAGVYSILAPFSILIAMFFIILNLFVDVNINKFIVFELTVYYFSLSLIAVQLISSELVKSRIAYVFIALVFTLGAIPMGNLRDAYMMAALPGALFYIYALIHFNQSRTTLNFLILLLFTSLFLSTLCYGVALSSIYWTFVFTMFLPIAYPTFLPNFFRVIREASSTKIGKVALFLGLLSCIVAVIAAITPYTLHSFDFVRTPGNVFNYNSINGGWPPPAYGAPSYQIWRLLLTWMPFREFEEVLFKSDVWKAGLDQWYIGLSTLPLLLVALCLQGKSKRYVLLLFLVAFICIAYIPYTYNNLIFCHLMQKFQFFQNVRTMPGLLPRGGVLLFFIFIAGIGLDLLLQSSRMKNSVFNQRLKILTIVVLLLFLVVGLFGVMFGMFSGLSHSHFKELKHGLTHFGIYLSLFSILCMMMLFGTKRMKLLISFVLLALTFTDLTISSSHYWRDGKIWYAHGGPHTLPKIENFGPIYSEKEHWAQLHAGVFHHIFMDPFYGDRTWITFASRPKFAPLLENWNRETRRVTAYPYFRYFTNGRYVAFETIQQIDTIVSPNKSDNWFYLHNQALVKNTPEANIKVRQKIINFTFNTVIVEINSPSEGFMVFYDNKNRYWRAYLNKKRTKIYPANFTFKAIKIPAGTSIVEWKFNPYPVKVMWIVFYISFMAYLVVVFLYWRQPITNKNYV